MNKTLQLHIDCGERTCSSEPGKFCIFVRTRMFGTIHFCSIWHDMDYRGRPTPLEEADGRLLRCAACLAAEPGQSILVLGRLGEE